MIQVGRSLFKTGVLTALIAASAAAQTATVQGVVSDSSQAAMAEVKVTATNLETGFTREALTNGQGFYAMPSLPVGRYKVEAARTGFASAQVPDIKLDTNQVARVDFALKVGTVAERVEVSAAAALLDSETSTVGQVIDNKRIVEMPLNGRNYLQLAALTAGVAPSAGGRTADEGGFVASGQHGYQVNITIDGLNNSSVASGGPLGFEAQAVKPSIDAVGEFKVVTNNLSAEYGDRMGGQIIVNLKSGTNQFHGSAFEFLRNSSFDGTNFFANRNGAKKPPFRQNQFGATAGGALIRNRTFLFGAYEGTRIRLGKSFVSTVPTARIREGDFGELRNIYDPATTTGAGAAMQRQPFPNRIIPKNRWDPLVPKLLTLYPAATTAVIANNYFFSPSESNDQNTYDIKGDHNISDTSRLSVRYSRRDKDRFEPGPLPLPGDGGLGTTTDVTAHSVVGTWSKTFGSSFTNDLRIGNTRMPTKFDIPFDKPLFEEFGIKGVPKTNLTSSTDHGLTRFSPAGYAEIGSRSFWPNINKLNLWQFSDTAFKQAGKHALRFGGEYKKETVFRNAARLSRGNMVFGREFTADPQNRAATGDGFAEFLLGWASGGTVGNENGEFIHFPSLALFVQDDWKLTPNLTLNLGVRYDIFYTPYFPDGGVSNFVLDRSLAGAAARLQQVRPSGKRDCGCENDLNNFAPRIGLAWRATSKTVVRSGFGVIYGRPDQNDSQFARFSNQPPDFVEVGLGTLDRINPRYFLKDGFPAVQLPATSVPGPNLVGVNARRAQMPMQYSQQWFFDLQRELPWNVLATAGYNGNGTRKMQGGLDYNLPFGPGVQTIAQRRTLPFYTGISVVESFGNLSYNALAFKLEKRFSQGLSFLSSYTWSKTIDNVTESLNNTGGQGALNPWDRSLDKARSVSDIRHNYAASASYEIPLGRGKAWMGNAPRALDLILGGWQLGGILSLRTGLPFTVLTPGGLTTAGGADRRVRNGNGALPAGQRAVERWFDISAFSVQPQYTFGTSGRNILDGPGLRNFDLSLAKRFTITERVAAQFRFESFNFTNTPAFGFPAATINAARAGEISAAGEPRRIQFALKLLW